MDHAAWQIHEVFKIHQIYGEIRFVKNTFIRKLISRCGCAGSYNNNTGILMTPEFARMLV